jgi:hypothetical protein
MDLTNINKSFRGHWEAYVHKRYKIETPDILVACML